MALIVDDMVEAVPIWIPPRSDWPELYELLCACSRLVGTASIVSTYKYYVHTMKVTRDAMKKTGRKYRIDRTTVANLYRRLDERGLPLTPDSIMKVLKNPIGPFIIDDSLTLRGEYPVSNYEPWQEDFGVYPE